MLITQQSIEEQVKNAYPFSVDKFRLSGPDNMITDLYGCFRSDNHDCIGGAVKKNYIPHTVEDIQALAVAAMDGFDGASLTCLWDNGHVIIIEPTQDYRRQIFGTKDNIFPRAIVNAQYGGLSSLVGSFGIYRDVCKNLMIARLAGRVVKMNIRHSNNLGNHLKVLVSQFSDLMKNWDKVEEEVNTMNSRKLDLAAFLSQVYPMPDNPTARIQKTYLDRIKEIVLRVEKERNILGRLNSKIGEATAWEAYNAVQGYEQHAKVRHGNPDQFTRALMALNTPLDAKAYSLALEMAS